MKALLFLLLSPRAKYPFRPLQLVLLFAFSAGMVFASAAPIQWTGDPTVTSANCLCSPWDPTWVPTTTETQNGPVANLEVDSASRSFGNGSAASDTVVGTLLLASSETVSLDIAAKYDTTGTNCQQWCRPSVGEGEGGLYIGQFSGDVSVFSMTGGAALLDVRFGSQASAFDSCPPDTGCEASLSASDHQNGMVNLAAGSYQIVTNWSDSNNAYGSSWSSGSLIVGINAPLSSVPEPRYVWPLAALLCMLLVVGIRRGVDGQVDGQ